MRYAVGLETLSMPPLSTKVALDDVPEIKGTPLRAPDNNHRQDSKSRHDREYKTWQQQLLHISRLLAFVGTSIEQGSDDGTVDLRAKLLAALHMVGVLERKVENFRKTSSISRLGALAPPLFLP